MGRLVYSTISSLDGYLVDADGNFDWAAPDPEVHAFVNDLERDIGTYLYGRRMYEVMRYWETAPDDGQPVERDYAEVWRAADKVVYSTTLDDVSTRRTRLERSFDATAVRDRIESADRDVSIGGATLAAHAIRAGLVDDWHAFLHPIVVGGGTPVFPDDVRVRLELVDERRFASGVVYLHHRSR